MHSDIVITAFMYFYMFTYLYLSTVGSRFRTGLRSRILGCNLFYSNQLMHSF